MQRLTGLNADKKKSACCEVTVHKLILWTFVRLPLGETLYEASQVNSYITIYLCKIQCVAMFIFCVTFFCHISFALINGSKDNMPSFKG